MEFWSKGLGRRSLIMELGHEKVDSDGEYLLLSGVVKAPVKWNYIMYLGARDWNEFFEVALRPQMATFLLCRKRVKTLFRLTLFLLTFLPLYCLALLRVALGFAPLLQSGVDVASPDLSGEPEIAEIDEGALT